MTTEEYQALAWRTHTQPRIIDDNEFGLMVSGLGIAGEAGEVADLIKKGIGHRHGFDEDELVKELGDVLWYAADIASRFGLTLDHIMEANIAKLKTRYPDGFSSERSLNRAD